MAVTVRWLAARHPRRGLASPARLRETLSHRAVISRGDVIRPSTTGRKITLADVGVHLGRTLDRGMPLAVSAEDSVLVLSAPRQGKTSQVIIPWLHTWPGPALATTIRPDVLLATATLRRAKGPVAVMAPTGMISWPDVLTWSPTNGCADFDKARSRADVMVTVGKSEQASDSTDGGYFALNATNLLAGWLHAAALSDGSASDVLDWAFDERRDDPIRILASHPQAASGTASMLDALTGSRPTPPGPACGPPRRRPWPRCCPRPPGPCSPPLREGHRPDRVPAGRRHLLPDGRRAASRIPGPGDLRLRR